MKIPTNYFKAFNVLRNSRQVLIRASVFAALMGLSACGGGGERVGDAEPNRYSAESGLAQKGPLMQGSQITINELSTPNFQPTGRSFGMEVSSNDGKFNPTGIYFLSPYLSTTAIGYYFNEITGAPSNDLVFLRGLSDLSAGADTSINVNVLSGFSKNRIINLLTGTNLLNPSTGMAYSSPPARLPFANARSQAQAENLKAFYIYNSASIFSGASSNGVVQPANFTALDLGRNRAADQILAAISAVVMTAGQNGNGVNTLLSQIEADFADDGLLNNSPKYSQAVQPRLCAAAAITDFAAVAANLNKFYGTSYQATDLSQWVDSSGCVDQVINKYRYTVSCPNPGAVGSTACPTGTEGKTTATPYIASTDDLGQCLSVSNNANLYQIRNGQTSRVVGSALVAKGDSYIVGMTLMRGTELSAYLQRTPPINGVCSATVPSEKIARVAKIITSAYQLASDLMANFDDAYASPFTRGLYDLTWGDGTKLYDDCFLEDGNTKALSRTAFESNFLYNGADQNQRNIAEIGVKRSNLQVLSEATQTNGDGSLRRMITISYDRNYADGTVQLGAHAVLITGSSYGSKMANSSTCTTPDASARVRAYGDRSIVDFWLNAANRRIVSFKLSNGNPTAMTYDKYIAFWIRDYSGVASYAVVSGPGLPSGGLKLLAPRVMRDSPNFGNVTGKYVDWNNFDNFQICRSGTSNLDATVADCRGYGAQGNRWGKLRYADPAQLDADFASLNLSVGGVYTFKIYNGDGWTSINGQASETPIASYSRVLKALPFNSTALTSLYTAWTVNSSLNVDAAQGFRNKTAFTYTTTYPNPVEVAFPQKMGWGGGWIYREGSTQVINPDWSNFWPATQQEIDIYRAPSTTPGNTTVIRTAPAPSSLMVTPDYGELGFWLSSRNGNTVQSILVFQ